MTEGETQQFWGPGEAGLGPACLQPLSEGLALSSEGW